MVVHRLTVLHHADREARQVARDRLNASEDVRVRDRGQADFGRVARGDRSGRRIVATGHDFLWSLHGADQAKSPTDSRKGAPQRRRRGGDKGVCGAGWAHGADATTPGGTPQQRPLLSLGGLSGVARRRQVAAEVAQDVVCMVVALGV